MREIRCLISSADAGETIQPTNSWAGTGSNPTTGPFYVIAAVVEGPVSESTGYVCNIKIIDDILRNEAAARLARTIPRSILDISRMLGAFLTGAKQRLPAPAAVRELLVRLSPFTSLAAIDGEVPMVRLTQSFEFSASHRLFRRAFSDEENLRVFGKCSNPAGHGHNYLVEVTVRGEPDGASGAVTDVGALDQAVKKLVIDDFDHKNLNVECPEFATLNPTVENIALVIWNRLAGRLGRCELVNVRVWETPKTYAEYAGDAS